MLPKLSSKIFSILFLFLLLLIVDLVLRTKNSNDESVDTLQRNFVGEG